MSTIHVLEPLVMEMLDDAIKDPLRDKKPIGLTPALNQLAKANRLLALEAAGQRHNLGTKFGVVDAQIAMALSGIDRDEMMELLLGTVLRIRRHEDSQPAGAPNGGSLGGSLNPNGGSLSLRTGRVSGFGGSGPPIREATGRQSLDVSLGCGGGASASYYSRTVGAGPGDRSFSPFV